MPPSSPRTLRWWPAALLLGIALGVVVFAQLQFEWPFQQRNLWTLATAILTALALLIWWLFGSRIHWSMRLVGLAILILLGMGWRMAFRLKGVSGDFVPIIEARWKPAPGATPANASPPSPTPITPPAAVAALDFPQFLGPTRDAQLPGPALTTDWTAQPPRLVWRQPIGGGWSGFALVGTRALTQEQHGPEERITAYDLSSGNLLWAHNNLARYDTTIAGEGPRGTPTVLSNRVYTLGATGILDCLDLASGKRLWTRSLPTDANCSVPEWGYSGSPWTDGQKVVVQAGGGDGKSLLAYRADTGEPLWSGGSAGVNYSSPFLVTLAGTPQFLVFGRRSLSSHDPQTGAVLWEHPFGVGMPLVANPILVSSNQVLITAGYNVGAELLAVSPGTNAPTSLWKSKRLKAKFANPVRRGDWVYGLDDGMMACLNLKDGSQAWKEGRYGHGQGLWIGEVYLLMSEAGDLVLLQPTPEGPNERARLPVFDSKTWNPIALQGDRVVVRNDREVACWQLPLAVR